MFRYRIRGHFKSRYEAANMHTNDTCPFDAGLTTQGPIIGVDLWDLTQGVARWWLATSATNARARSRRCIVASMSTMPPFFRKI